MEEFQYKIWGDAKKDTVINSKSLTLKPPTKDIRYRQALKEFERFWKAEEYIYKICNKDTALKNLIREDEFHTQFKISDEWKQQYSEFLKAKSINIKEAESKKFSDDISFMKLLVSFLQFALASPGSKFADSSGPLRSPYQQ